jgi:hypothetical protein
MMTLLEFSDVNGKPQVKIDLPPLLMGSKVRLHLSLQRTSGARNEILVVDGQFRVAAVGVDAGCSPQRQVVSVESLNVTPTWRSIKKTVEWRRALPPVRAPRTIVE